MSKSKIISEWFQTYSHDIYNFLVYYTNKVDVEDMVQDVFIKAINGMDTYRNDSSPKTWLFSIARNLAIDEARKRKTKGRKIVELMNEKKNDLHYNETPESIYQRNEMKKEIYLSINSLKRNYRDVVVLRGIQELSVMETAEVLNWSTDKVRTTYYRALNSLRKKGGHINE